MSFVGRAWRYVARKRTKSTIIFLILAVLFTALITANAVSSAANKSGAELTGKVAQGFTLSNNYQANMGTSRGGGVVKAADIEKIANVPGVERHVERQNVFADLVDAKNIRLDSKDLDPDKEEKIGNAVQVWGTSDSELDNNFRSGTINLVAGRGLVSGDKNKSLIHEDLAKANGLKIGDKLKLKGNIYDADNVKQATQTVETEIVGIFSGSNDGKISVRFEHYANTVYTDLETSSQIYQSSSSDANYQDATFFVAKDAKFDDVVKKAGEQSIDWSKFQLANSNQYMSGITNAVDAVSSTMNSVTIATVVFAAIVLSLVLILWLNDRKKETGVLLSIGTKKLGIVAQYLVELVITGVFAFAFACLLSSVVAQGIGNSVLSSVNESAKQQLGSGMNLSGGMESSAAAKTLDDISVALGAQTLIQPALIGVGVMIICVAIVSAVMLRKSPRELLVNIR